VNGPPPDQTPDYATQFVADDVVASVKEDQDIVILPSEEDDTKTRAWHRRIDGTRLVQYIKLIEENFGVCQMPDDDPSMQLSDADIAAFAAVMAPFWEGGEPPHLDKTNLHQVYEAALGDYRRLKAVRTAGKQLSRKQRIILVATVYGLPSNTVKLLTWGSHGNHNRLKRLDSKP